MSLDKVCALTEQNIPPYVLSQTNTGVIYVRQASFTIKNIGQKTSWPGAANIVTVTLDSAVPLFGVT